MRRALARPLAVAERFDFSRQPFSMGQITFAREMQARAYSPY